MPATTGPGPSSVTDGTPEGTVLVTDLHAGPLGSNPSGIVNAAARLYFFADDGTHELWSSDGTPDGTVRLCDFLGMPAGCSAQIPTAVGHRLFFSADDGAHGVELWSSDGTPEGTVMLEDLNPGPGGSYPRDFTDAGGTLFFSADDGTHGREPWALPIPGYRPPFHRGDPNSSSTIDISDGIAIFGFLFLSDPTTLACNESADANNDGTIDISDGISLLNWLFVGGPEPAAPGPTDRPCGVDPDAAGSPGDLGCGEYPTCP